jgi:hypothetical protein
MLGGSLKEAVHKEWSLQPEGEVAVGGSSVWGEVEGRKLQQWVDLVRVTMAIAKLYSYVDRNCSWPGMPPRTIRSPGSFLNIFRYYLFD